RRARLPRVGKGRRGRARGLRRHLRRRGRGGGGRRGARRGRLRASRRGRQAAGRGLGRVPPGRHRLAGGPAVLGRRPGHRMARADQVDTQRRIRRDPLRRAVRRWCRGERRHELGGRSAGAGRRDVGHGLVGADAMGAFGLVSESFKAVFLAEVGAAPPTALASALLHFYGVPDVKELNHMFTRRRNPAGQAEKVRAARVVTETAKGGDPVAVGVVNEQGRRLAFYAGIAARQTGLDRMDGPVPVVMSGSVLADRDSPVAAALAGHLPEMLPGAEPRHATLPPVAGAALDALAEGGVTLSPEVITRLTATLPPPSFFQT